MGLSEDSSIEYPVVMTEPMGNPNYTRGAISEMMFECYGVPALSYMVDSLCAFNYNSK